jgi:restriction endonuclease S subunit
MKKKLSDIAEIRTGYNFRSISNVGLQDVCVISAKDLNNNFTDLEMFLIPASYDGYLRKGDILVKSRGTSFEAKVFNVDDSVNKYIAVNTLLIVRLKTDEYKPSYIAHIINSGGVQLFLRGLASGQTVPILSPASLGILQCPEIPIERQEEIEVITETIDDYRVTMAKYIKAQEDLVKAIENKITEGVK